MQLPRGRFERFVRDVKIKDILAELEEKKFSGCLSGILGEPEGELIFEGGEIILAQSLKCIASDVFLELFSNPDGKVTAELSHYSDPQIKLAKEFNQKFLIKPGSYKTAFSSFLNQNSARKTESLSNKGTTSKENTVKEILKTDRTACAHVVSDENFDEETILSIDESEIEAIKKEFSSGAADLLKRIHMDHLIQNENNGGKNE